MFARAASVFVLALPILATATAAPRGGSECDTGSLQCCSSVQTASSYPASKLIALLGIVVDATAIVGLTCSPIIGITQCTQQAACCTGNNFKGLIVIGCNTINV